MTSCFDMARVFIGVGSNVNPRANVRRALRRLAREVAVVAVSTVYRTALIMGAPMGGLSRGKPDSRARSAEPALSAAKGPRAHQGAKRGPRFYDCVAEIATEMPPAELRAALRRIEAELGRRRTVGAAPCGRPFTAEACPPVVRRGGCATSKYAPRTIDLDVLLYDDLAAATDGFVLPDPQIAQWWGRFPTCQ